MDGGVFLEFCIFVYCRALGRHCEVSQNYNVFSDHSTRDAERHAKLRLLMARSLLGRSKSALPCLVNLSDVGVLQSSRDLW